MSAEATRESVLARAPGEDRTMRLAGASTVVREAGSGPPLVLLHGGIECGGAYWAPVIARLAERRRVIVPDVPGFGASEPVPRLDAAAFRSWLAELVRETCPEPPELVAHSLFGSFAARFATVDGGVLRRLTVYGAPGIGAYRMPLGLKIAAARADLRPTARNQARFLPWPFLDPDRTRARDPVWFAAFLAYMAACGRVPHTRSAMRRLIKAGTRPIAADALDGIEIPTALLWGRHDRMVGVELAVEASERFGWPLEVVEEAGHVPHVERPEAFVAALSSVSARELEGSLA